jgi:hypothetical protein
MKHDFKVDVNLNTNDSDKFEILDSSTKGIEKVLKKEGVKKANGNGEIYREYKNKFIKDILTLCQKK